METRKCKATIIKNEMAKSYTVLIWFTVKVNGEYKEKFHPYYGFKTYERAIEFSDEIQFGDTSRKIIKVIEGKEVVPRIVLFNKNCEKMLNSPKYIFERSLRQPKNILKYDIVSI